MNIIICVDNEDPKVGHFVQDCADQTMQFTEGVGNEVQRLNSNTLTDINLAREIDSKNGLQFILTAFSHGTNSSLYTASGDYVSDVINHTYFLNSFFYTWACCAGDELGNILINNNCKVFIGYTDFIYAPSPGSNNYEAFLSCALSGLKVFITENITAIDAFNAMLDCYDEQILLLKQERDVDAARKLSNNKRHLYFAGNGNCTVREFIIE